MFPRRQENKTGEMFNRVWNSLWSKEMNEDGGPEIPVRGSNSQPKVVTFAPNTKLEKKQSNKMLLTRTTSGPLVPPPVAKAGTSTHPGLVTPEGRPNWFQLTKILKQDDLCKKMDERREQIKKETRERIGRMSPRSQRFFDMENKEGAQEIYAAANAQWGKKMEGIEQTYEAVGALKEETDRECLVKESMQMTEDQKQRTLLMITWDPQGNAKHALKVFEPDTLDKVRPLFRDVETVAAERRRLAKATAAAAGGKAEKSPTTESQPTVTSPQNTPTTNTTGGGGVKSARKKK